MAKADLSARLVNIEIYANNEGFKVEYHPPRNIFEMRSGKLHGIVLNPDTLKPVPSIRSLTRRQWEEVIKWNAERLKNDQSN